MAHGNISRTRTECEHYHPQRQLTGTGIKQGLEWRNVGRPCLAPYSFLLIEKAAPTQAAQWLVSPG